jgi:D-glycero-alpha-D-manno-heptose-7-phosphate kinase
LVISKTPYRISFFGGGTDYPAWYLEEGGAVLSTTIDKYCYISCRVLPPFFNIRHRIVWSHIETVSTISEILHPAVREGMRFLNFDDRVGLEIHHQGDLPARAGMGSSSSFAVGLIKALLALRGQMIDKHGLALKAIELEQNVLKESVGSQDQIATAYGGLNVVRFYQGGEFRVEPVAISDSRKAELEARLLLLYLGTSRVSSEIASKLIENFANRQAALRRMHRMVDQALSILANQSSLDDFGRLLHEAWMLKRELSTAVSTPLVDQVYETATKHGALGGKLLGAGGTGFMVFYVPPDSQASVRQALSAYLHVPFKFENAGSTLIYCQPDDFMVSAATSE